MRGLRKEDGEVVKDTGVMVGNLSSSSAARVLNRTEWFAQASGARLNREKTVLKTFGRWNERERQELPLTLVSGDMRVLGANFDSEGLGGGNWAGILKKVEQFWRLRQLTVEGKGRDPVCPVQGLVLGQADVIWKAVALPDLLNHHRDLAWLVVHEILRVRGVMHASRLSSIAVLCPRAGCGQEEMVRHLLLDCGAAQALWKVWSPFLGQYLGQGIKLDSQLVLFGVCGRNVGPVQWRAAWLAMNCVKEALWKSRCFLALEGKLLSTEKVKRPTATVKDYVLQDSRRLGHEGAIRVWGHATWTMLAREG
ncbi:hypothetical protein SKAU_G00239800 [Synaphobranchus kaupii]|uniref:Reverse transcriptase zinc-binding domain-containing protein n=1 Tax=Synaphobranchus kaupii TaxID=118154 RepID=A0A9Q1F7B6_SYNKA|nr:hypothetical protein SKAU_G00239800 [Synaphobranchus kaupii]